MVDIKELPGKRLSTAHVTVKLTDNPDELDSIGDQYKALAAEIRRREAPEVEQIADVLAQVPLSSPVNPPTDAVGLYRAGLRKVDEASGS